MNKLIILAILIATGCAHGQILRKSAAGGGGSPAGWAHRLTLTAAAQGSTLTNHPVWVGAIQDNTLKVVGSGGTVQNANGYDVIFTSDTACTAQLFWEQDGPFDGTVGKYPAWVAVTLTTAPTDFYMCYGKTGITTFQSTPTSVWDANYKGVWHLGDGTTLNLTDSTATPDNGSIVGAASTASTGEIDGSAVIPLGSFGYIDLGTASKLNITGTSITVSAWVNSNREGVVFGAYGGDPFPGYGLALGIVPPNNTIAFWDGSAWRTATTNVINSAWHHIAAVVNGSSTLFYLDGVADGTGGAAAISGYSGNRTIGISPPLSQQLQGQKIDEVRVSNSSRSANWIAAEYASGAGTLVSKGSLL